MQIISGTTPGALCLASRGRDLSPDARRRLKWMDYYESHGRNAALTCRYFGISRQTFHRWRRRYNPQRPSSLEERSRRPHRVRQPTWTPELVEAVQHLGKHCSRWGKDKLTPLLRAAGWSISTSMAGRILGHLRRQGILVEPPLRPPPLSWTPSKLARPSPYVPPGRRWVRVPSCLRERVPTAADPPVRTASPVAQAQRARRSGPTYPHRGAL